ncbi:TIGR02206 family membrane protein [Rubritalea halochordaticola]
MPSTHMLAMQHFDTCHLLTLASIATVAILLIQGCRKLGNPANSLLTTPLAYLCFLSFPATLISWSLATTESTLENTVPLHLCDLASFACGFALLTRHKTMCELAYYWGLAGTVQGLLTPVIAYSFPHPLYLAFFWQHGVVVITALLLPLGLGWRPRKNSVLRIFLITQLYVVVAMSFNFAAGTNYGFLSAKPKTASLLDLLPAWPYYILVMEVICLAIFSLLYLPFRTKSLK